jgi:polyisoprenyl-phosphate glycosyltransferase
MKKISLSIIVPVYNSLEILPNLVNEIEKNRVKHQWDLQLILVDDSGDNEKLCFEKIKELKCKFSYIVGIRLSRNFGQQSALLAGLNHINRDYVAIIDDDLQDPPSLISHMLQELRKNKLDVVYGERHHRKETRILRFLYWLFYQILHKFGEVKLPKDAGDFCIMKREVVSHMLSLHENKPYLRGIRYWVGFKQKAYPYERPIREIGESGWQLGKLISFAKDALFSFSDFPLKFILRTGIIMFVLSMFFASYIIINYFLYGNTVAGFSTIALLTMIYGSLNIIFIGIIGEYLSRTYDQTKDRPKFIVDEIV